MAVHVYADYKCIIYVCNVLWVFSERVGTDIVYIYIPGRPANRCAFLNILYFSGDLFVYFFPVTNLRINRHEIAYSYGRTHESGTPYARQSA